MRQHERRVHPVEYKLKLEVKSGIPESELMAKIAKLEVKSKGGIISIKAVKAATGLTEHQIRSRRVKLEYQRYLERARQQQKKVGSTLFGLPRSVAQALAQPPSGFSHAEEPTLAAPIDSRPPTQSDPTSSRVPPLPLASTAPKTLHCETEKY